MSNTPTKFQLTAPQQRLVEVMQELNFGRITKLTIRSGEPVLSPPPYLIQDIKIGAESGPRPETLISDFHVKREVAEMFEHLRRLHNGTVEVLEVKHGLPFKLEISHTLTQ